MTDDQERIRIALAAAVEAAGAAAGHVGKVLNRNATVAEVVRQLELVQTALVDEANRVRELTELLNALGATQGDGT